METLKRIFRTTIQLTEQQKNTPRSVPANLKMKHDEASGLGFVSPPQANQPSNRKQMVGGPPQPRQPLMADKKVGRNESCPCNSGKKYKKCCGKID